VGNRVKIEIGELEINQDHNIEIGKEIDVLIRADDIQHDDNSSMQAEVVSKTFRGADFLYTLKLQSGVEVLALVPSHHNHEVGEKIGITLALDHVVTF
jgi:iron(III) transport system ATP-binding protein